MMQFITKRFKILFIFNIGLGCSVGSDAPVPSHSPAGRALSSLEEVGESAKKVQNAAHSLESLIDEGRRRIKKGESREIVIKDIEERLLKVEERHTEFKKILNAFSTQLEVDASKEKTSHE